MAKDKSTDELVFDGMPGADAKTEEDVQPFQVDMNFEDEPKEETVEETETEEETTEEELLQRKQQKKLQRSKSKSLLQRKQKVSQKKQNKRAFREMMSNLWKQWRKDQRNLK